MESNTKKDNNNGNGNNSRYKVILQETLLNTSNIQIMIEELYDLLLDFEMELHNTRNNFDLDDEFKMESIPSIKYHNQNKSGGIFTTNSLEYALFSFSISSNKAHQGLILITGN